MKSIRDYSLRQITPPVIYELRLQLLIIWDLFSKGDISADEMIRVTKTENLNVVEYILMLLEEIQGKLKTDDLNNLYETGTLEAKHLLEAFNCLKEYEEIVRYISIVSNNIAETPEYWKMRAEKIFNDKNIRDALIRDIRNGSTQQTINFSNQSKILPFNNNSNELNPAIQEMIGEKAESKIIIESMIRESIIMPEPDPKTEKYIPLGSIPDTISWVKLKNHKKKFPPKLFDMMIKSKCSLRTIEKYYRDL
jgi:hypothetical protein